MKNLRWYLFLVLSLTAISFVFYLIQIAIFHRIGDTFFYMLQDIAFVPVQVLLVTLLLNQLLSMREKRMLLKKVNMLIGSFYIEVGTGLIKHLSQFSNDLSVIRDKMLVSTKWTEKDFLDAALLIKDSETGIDSKRGDLNELKFFLESKRYFLLSLLANPNLLEHDAFTNLLWAVFHLMEELSARNRMEELPRTDYDHLSGDIRRAYTRLLAEWLAYMNHLKEDYPYLFSLAARMNPLDAHASPIVKG
jgi:hypothetical protein